jgi:hypothetical protein
MTDERGETYFERDLASVACMNILQQPKTNEVGKHARTSIGKKR